MNSGLQLLSPLDIFYIRAGIPLPPAASIKGGNVPEPYRQLLVHNNDMTPTLEAYYGETVHLRVLARQQENDALMRMVTLVLNGSKRPVEFGAICICLRLFSPAAREQVLESRIPLGTILAHHNIARVSRPRAFFRVMSDATMNEALGLTEPQWLYGRRNILLTPEGETIADIVEILPPLVR